MAALLAVLSAVVLLGVGFLAQRAGQSARARRDAGAGHAGSEEEDLEFTTANKIVFFLGLVLLVGVTVWKISLN